MRPQSFPPRTATAALVAFMLAGSIGFAAGPYRLDSYGNPLRWNSTRPVTLHPDRGRLGGLGNMDAVTGILLPAIERWASIETSKVRLALGASLPADIETAEQAENILQANYSPIIFDSQGNLLRELGIDSRNVLAVSSIWDTWGAEIRNAFIIINGLQLDGNPGNGEVSQQAMIGVVAHELGHVLNLGHSQVNGHLFYDDPDDPAYRRFGPPPPDCVELMFPFISENPGWGWPTLDDRAALSTLYPAAEFSAYGKISGRYLWTDRKTGIQGANVVARNINNPYREAVSSVSGFRSIGEFGGSPWAEFMGRYEITGLPRERSYLLEVVNLIPVPSAGSCIGNRYPHPKLPGEEEFYSGPAEGSDNPPDDPLEFHAVYVEEEREPTGIDIIANRMEAKVPPRAISYGQQITDRFSEPGEAKIYTFLGQVDDCAKVSVTSYSSMSLRIELISPSGLIFTESPLEVILPESGEYRLVIRRESYYGGSDVNLTVQKTWSAAGAQAIAFGETRTGSMSQDEQRHFYSLQAESGDRIALVYGPLYPIVSVFGPEGRLLSRVKQSLDFAVAQTGRHIVVLERGTFKPAIDYGLTVQRVNNAVKALPFTVGRTQPGGLSLPGEVRTFTFRAASGDALLIRCVPTSGFLSFQTHVYDPDGILVGTAAATLGFSLQIAVRLPKTGLYALLVRGDIGPFALFVQNLTTPAEAIALSPRHPTAGAISQKGEWDTFALAGKAADQVSIRLVPGFWCSFEMYNAAGRLLSKTSGRLPQRIDMTLPETGTYTLLVGDLSASTTGSYAIDFKTINDPASAVVLRWQEPLSASITAEAERDLFTLDAEPGDRIVLWARVISGLAWPQLELYDPDGISILTAYGTSEARLLGILPKKGRYTILAGDYDARYSCSYVLNAYRVNRILNPILLAPSKSSPGSLNLAGEIDPFIWQSRAGDSAILRLTRTSGSFKPKIDIYDPDLNALTSAYSEFGRLDLALPRPPKDGYYLAVVSDAYGSWTGTYDLTLDCAGCPAASAQTLSRLIFPYVNETSSEVQGIAITNTASSWATLQLSAFDAAGKNVGSAVRRIAPFGQTAEFVSQFFVSAVGRSGWLDVAADVPGPRGFFLTMNPAVSRMDGAAVSSSVSTDFILVGDSRAGPAGTELDLVNPSGVGATATVDALSSSGAVIASKKVELPARGQILSRLSDFFPGAKLEGGYYLRCKSDIGLAGLMLVRFGDAIQALAALDAGWGSNTLYSPHLAVGGGYVTRIALVNRSTKVETITLTALDENGLPHSEAAHNPVVIKMPANGMAESDVGVAFGIIGGIAPQTGWLKVESTSAAVTGSITFGSSDGGATTTLPLSRHVVTDALFSHVAQDEQYFTGLAFLNPAKQPASVKVEVFTAQGVFRGSASLVLAPGARISKLLGQLVAAASRQLGGYIRVKSDQGIIAFALFGTNSQSVLAAIPPQ